MTSYNYSPSSTIERVVFKKADSGTPRAYIFAGNAADEKNLLRLAKALDEKGYTIIHAVEEGRPALEVRGYMREKELLNLLTDQSCTHGSPKIVKETKAKRSIIQTVRDNSLPFASGGFILADVGYTMYGHKSGRPEDTLAGASYMVGSATMGLLGTHAQATKEIKKEAKKLWHYAQSHDLDLSRNVTLPALITDENKRSAFQNIVDTLQTYPAEIGNSFTALAGSLIAYSSWKYRVGPNMSIPKASMSHADKVAHSAGLKDIGLGLTTLTSGMIGAWVKEKKHDPDVPKAQGMGAIWEWVQEKPLRVAGIGYMISTGFHTLSTIQEYKHAKLTGDKKSLGAVPWRALFIGSTIIAEILLTISSKGHGEGVKSDPSTDESIIAVAAEMIAQQKPQMQAELIENIGGFLGRPEVLGGKDTDIKQKLAHQVDRMKHSPWVRVLEATKHEPSADPHPSTWQQKTLASQAVPQHTAI